MTHVEYIIQGYANIGFINFCIDPDTYHLVRFAPVSVDRDGENITLTYECPVCKSHYKVEVKVPILCSTCHTYFHCKDED